MSEHDGDGADESARFSSVPIDLVLGESDFSSWVTEILTGVENAVQGSGTAMRLTVVRRRCTPDLTWLDALLKRGTRGVLVARTRLNAYQQAVMAEERIPVVTIGAVASHASVPAVTATIRHGVLTAVQHLTDLGHQRIALIGDLEEAAGSEDFLAGYREALRIDRLPFTPSLVSRGLLTRAEGHRLGLELLALPIPPTAVIASGDVQALGVCQAALDRGLRIPDDLSVVGFDDLPLSSWTDPPLTTVRQPWREMASAAVRVLNGLAVGKTPTRPTVEFATTLVIRASTRPPAERQGN